MSLIRLLGRSNSDVHDDVETIPVIFMACSKDISSPIVKLNLKIGNTKPSKWAYWFSVSDTKGEQKFHCVNLDRKSHFRICVRAGGGAAAASSKIANNPFLVGAKRVKGGSRGVNDARWT